MRKIFRSIGALVCVSLFSSAAFAQATRTWVSGVGDDANPCSRTAPCKTFAGAISKTANGGEISVLDPGGFGAVTITKSITISGDGTLAGILAAGTNGVVINALATDRVTLRNLSIVGAGTGLNGVRVLAVGQVVIDHCVIQGFKGSPGRGIDVATADVAGTALKSIILTNSSIFDNTQGIRVADTSGDDFDLLSVTHSNVVNNNSIGIEGAQGNVRINVDESNISNNVTDGIRIGSATGVANLEGNMFATNAASALNAAVSGARIRIANNTIVNNTTSITIAAGATVESTSPASNRVAGNPSGAAPNATYTQQ